MAEKKIQPQRPEDAEQAAGARKAEKTSKKAVASSRKAVASSRKAVASSRKAMHGGLK